MKLESKSDKEKPKELTRTFLGYKKLKADVKYLKNSTYRNMMIKMGIKVY